MVSPDLQKHAAELEMRLFSTGITVTARRTLANGLQFELEAEGAVCCVNLYHSSKKGFSVTSSGGDPGLLDKVTGSGSMPLPTESPGSWTGSDETGKGDYLGPLVVCAVFCTFSSAKKMVELGAADSKTIANRTVLILAEKIRRELGDAHAAVIIDPPEYNRRFRELRKCGRNSLDLLAEAHGKAISTLLQRGYIPDRMVVDKFCSRRRLKPYLPDTDALLELRPRAEDNPAVAAASVIARALYLDALAQLERELGAELIPGAGRQTDSVASELVRLHGPEVLEKCAKMHFRNTLKVLSTDLTEA
jgi:ribonuclease HIII